MKRVQPNTSSPEAPCTGSSSCCSVTKCHAMAELTVWRKSLLFNCSGFTVFNAEGNIAYLVDNYSTGNNEEVVLMDSDGKPLLTSRLKNLNLCFGKQCMVYDGEGTANPGFIVRKNSSLFHSKTMAHVTPCRERKSCNYEIEGSYQQGSCVVYGEGRQLLAEIRQKETASNRACFGADVVVFRLVVYAGIDTKVAMSIVVQLD